MSRIVLDTNVFIAARFNPRSASAKIIGLCLKKKHKLILSHRLCMEAYRILKNVKARGEFEQRIRRLFEGASRVKPSRRVFAIKEDPDDNKFLECSLAGKADYLITSDRHLLRLGNFSGTRILKPTQFLKRAGHA